MKFEATFQSLNAFLYKQRNKLGQNQAKAKQHLQAELLLFENYLLSASKLSKNNRRYSKECTKNKCESVCFNEVIWLMTMKMRLKVTTWKVLCLDMDTNVLNINVAVLNIKCVSYDACMY